MKQQHSLTRISVAILALGLPALSAHAQLVISDTLTGASSSFDWKALNGACLTAGTTSTTTGAIPACSGLAYYTSKGSTLVGGVTGTLPDPVGQGALRLTNGDTQSGGSNGDNQTGAVVSNFTFPSNEGLQVTWTSVTYGGDNLNNTGADGISFFLSDGSVDPSVGGLGGSLGYSCSNVNGVYDGVVKAYIGIGIDEYGNFANKSDNTSTGYSNGSLAPKRITVRGAGDTSAASLAAAYPTYYVSGNGSQADWVHNTCKTGTVWNYSGHKINNVSSGNDTGVALNTKNYVYISSSKLPSSVSIANQEATNPALRANAIPITYQLKITADGIMNFSYSVNGGASTSVITDQNITTSNGPLPASFRFGFSSGTGGGNNVHEITCFKAAPSNLSGSSAGSNTQSFKVVADTQVFLAAYQPVNWWGSLTASSLRTTTNGSLIELTNLASATWDAGCNLTGGVCSSVTDTPTVTAQDYDSGRVILTSDGAGGGLPFRATSLTSAQQTALGSNDPADTTTATDRVNYLRGLRTNEISHNGTYRTRTGVLGDIVDSSPAWVSTPNSAYAALKKDNIVSSDTVSEGASYAAFVTQYYSRMNVLYVGANDGMLHGFRTGLYNPPTTTGGSPTLDKTNDDGDEVLAYVPAQVINAIHPVDNTLDYTDSQYYHNFFVDATPGTGDLYYSGKWHTWLVGGLGVGGHPGGAVDSNTASVPAPVSALFALDVTDPSRFTEANAASLVMGEWNSNTIACTGDTSSSKCGTNMGQTLGTPLIRRLHDGTWGVIWGNGTNSTNGHSGIFIMHVKISDGTKTFQYIEAEAPTGGGGGIAEVAAADLDGDHITDYVYAGDTLGRLWRFDLTDHSSSNWTVQKIFQTPASATTTGAPAQPITTQPLVTKALVPNQPDKTKVMIFVGTGQKLPITTTNSEIYATGQQSIYGIWDADMTHWNSLGSTKFAALSLPNQPVPTSTLVTQTYSAATTIGTDSWGDTITAKTLTDNPICWADNTKSSSSATCASYTKMGSKIDLPGTNEQVIFNPSGANSEALFNTTIPGTSTIVTCQSTGAAGYSTALSTNNGGAGSGTLMDGYSAVGLNGTGTPNVYITGSGSSAQMWLGTETSNDHFKGVHLNAAGGSMSRATWTKLR
ncbi:MAG: pilus assembly protein [Burkholderiaceae bacterium]